MPSAGQPLPLVVLRPNDPAAAREFLERLPEPPPAAVEGPWLLVSSTEGGRDLLRARLRDAAGRWALWPGTEDVVASDELRVFADLAGLRQLLPALRGAAAARLDPGARFFFGPLWHAISMTNRAELSLRGGDTLNVFARLDATAIGSRWQALLTDAGAAREVPEAPASALATIALDRSFLALLSTPESFFDEGGTLGVQGFLSIADQIDGAQTSFVEDLVGGLEEPITVYILPVPPPGDDDDIDQPRLTLPGLALTARFAEAEVEKVLVRAASALAMITNGERAQNGQPVFRLRALRSDDADGFEHVENLRGLTARLAPWRGPSRPPLEQGLSPTLVFGDDRFVLATTRSAAMSVLDAAQHGNESRLRGDTVELRGPAIADWTAAMRAPLELSRRLDEGDTAAATTQFFDMLIAVTRAFERVRLEVTPSEHGTTLQLQIARKR